MKVLVLSPYPEGLLPAFRKETVTIGSAVMEKWPEVDWVVSYGYRKIIKDVHILKYPNRIINLHIGLLPWNKGASPNFWSWFDDTPKGVTIHYVDHALDSGDIIAQEQILFPPDTTLAQSYQALRETIEQLFISMWPNIKKGEYMGIRQGPGGSGHVSTEINTWMSNLPLGWDTPGWAVSALGATWRGVTQGTSQVEPQRIH
jgi:methionyl-tRNA formyltransferase